MTKIGRNDDCPCGSGKKYKKCCLAKDEAVPRYSPADRASALAKLDDFLGDALADEDDAAWDEFYASAPPEWEELDDPEWNAVSEAAYDMWFAFDHRLADGRRPVDVFLSSPSSMNARERCYLERMRDTAVRLFDVEDLVPGVSVTLRALAGGSRVTVTERTASRTMTRHMCVAVRVNQCGASGGPEMEADVLCVPELVRRETVASYERRLEELRAAHPSEDDVERHKRLGPFFHNIWLRCIVEPPIPALANTDGEDLLWTRSRFDVLDPARIAAVLDGTEELEREEQGSDVWIWTGPNSRGDSVTLGRIELSSESLLLETNSAARGMRGRELIETRAAGAVRHKSTTHENTAAIVREAMRNPRRNASTVPDPCEEIPKAEVEMAMLDYLARHYRKWLGDSIPLLEGRTPREAADDARLRPRLVELLGDLERQYETALKQGEPAYDPSWMWEELGLEDRTRLEHPPRLAHERLFEVLQELGGLARDLAENARRAPGFDPKATTLGPSDVAGSLDVQRLVRARLEREKANGGGAASARETVADVSTMLLHLVNHELYLRKTFLVDEALAFQLSQTDADAPGGDLRLPFPSFALVFTDRATLSLCERLLSTEHGGALAGQILRVLTVYVTEERNEDARTIHFGFAPDSLGADPPHFVHLDVRLDADTRSSALLDAAIASMEGPGFELRARHLRALARVVINAVLYATSAGVRAETVTRPRARRNDARKGGASRVLTSDEVFHLPGTIDIRELRRFQNLGRTKDGAEALHRFMVRGHWRRPQAGWRDQSLRWIAPYWKGPDLAAIIERTYRLTP
jgi:hypothetical protein